MARVVAAPHEPVVRVPIGVQQAFPAHVELRCLDAANRLQGLASEPPQVLHDRLPGILIELVGERGHGRAPDTLPDDPVQLRVRDARLPAWIRKIRSGSPVAESPMAYCAVLGEQRLAAFRLAAAPQPRPRTQGRG